MPGDVSVTGIDDIELALMVTPPLTTVHVPTMKWKKAATALSDLVEGGAAKPCVELQISLEIRGSFGLAKTV